MRSAMRLHPLLSALALLALSACTHPVVARAPVLYPARIPARAFPEILVAGAALPEGDLMDPLVAHLAAEGRHVVRKVDVKQLEPMREAGAIAPLTLTLVIEPSLYTDVRDDWDVVPVQICDFYWGCFIDYQTLYVSSPALIGEVRVTVYEGPTARVLQTETFEVVSLARDGKEARAKVFDQLVQQLLRGVDFVKSTQRIELVPVKKVAEAERALSLIKAGKWEEGRKLLEQAAQRLGGKSRKVQARVWYNLGMARWHSTPSGELPPAVYESAARALKQAVALDERYRGSLAALERARERQQVLDEQRRATAHNRALYEEMRGAPAAPATSTPVPVEPSRQQ